MSEWGENTKNRYSAIKFAIYTANFVFFCLFRWLEGLISELVTEDQWLYYITLLTDTMWPGGELRKSTVHEKTSDEKLKTKEEAVRSLSNFFGCKQDSL